MENYVGKEGGEQATEGGDGRGGGNGEKKKEEERT